MTRVKVSVLPWDMGHNALGRAHVLADLLRDAYDVDIVGAHFPNSGSQIWRPLRDSAIPMQSFTGTSLPRHFSTMETMAKQIDCDVLYVSKPRLPSYGLGVLAKERRNRPLVLDCDDRELSFFDLSDPCDLDEVMTRRIDADFVKPFGRTWTQYCESLVPYAERLTVSNVSLQHLLGGTVIPHARDEKVFDPALYDRPRLREDLGLAPSDRAVMFAGTARSHKGLDEVATALRKIGDPRLKLCVFGEAGKVGTRTAVSELGDQLRVIPYQSFENLPRIVVCADLVCILQDPRSEISRYQIPAKITDALALGVPCLVRENAAIAPLIEAGAVHVVQDGEELDAAIERVLGDVDLARQRTAAARRVFLESYSYAAVRPRLHREIELALQGTTALHPKFRELLRFARSGFASSGAATKTDERREAAERMAMQAQGEARRLSDDIWRQVRELDQHLTRRAEVEGVRRMVDELVPDFARVAVVSKGDPDLIHLGLRTTQHFPTIDGVYAGHHPDTSAQAFAYLDEARSAGVEYLVLPRSEFWWRDQYLEFWRHLSQDCRLVGDDEEVAAIFAVAVHRSQEKAGSKGDREGVQR